MEPDLVIRAQHGDEAAYAAIAASIADRFLAVARRILRDLDLAEDATQQALLSIWQDLPQLRDPARFDAWSYRLLVRACYAEGRKGRRWAPNLRILPLDNDAGDDLGSVVDRDELETGFRRLSIDHRTVVVLLRLDLSNSDLWVSWTPNAQPDSLPAHVSRVGNSVLQFKTNLAHTECAEGGVGTYDSSLSPAGSKLTLRLRSDPCAPRSAVLPGVWVRSNCKIQAQGIADDDCLGGLEAGDYNTTYFVPKLPFGADWQPNPGAVTFTVPDGWANEEDWPVRYVLTPAADYETGRTFDQGGIDAISLWARHAPAAFDASCQAAPKPGVGGSIGAIESAFRHDPALSVGPSHAVSIDGHQAEWLDVGIARDYRAPCHRADGVVVPLIVSTSADRYGFPGLGGHQPSNARVVLIDLGGETMYVVLASALPAAHAPFADQALPIVESFRFGP